MYDDSNRVVPLFIRLTQENKDLVVYGEEKLLDFTYLEDAIFGILKCIQSFDQVKNDVFNIASGKGVSIVELARLIQEYMDTRNKIVIRPTRAGEITRFVADISRARAKLGYDPKTEFTEGIKKSIEWYESK